MKNTILKASVVVSGAVFLLSACALDSLSTVPMILTAVSGGYLAVFGLVNQEAIERRLFGG
ncbi:MAG: hypothetical protein IJG86_00240 [Clostridia bacterium]|nr:hypothetical protein [Clostridia bacterium]